MGILRKGAQARNLMINFRLTEDEHTRLQEAVKAAGARTISDYYRGLVIDGSFQMITVEQRLAKIEDKLAAGHIGSAEGVHLA